MRVRYFIPVILLLALLAFFALLLNLQYFNITELVFEGNKIYQDSTLIKDTNLKTNENGFKQLFDQGGKLYLFRYSKEEEHLKNIFPYIKDIRITYQVPDTISYVIEERNAIFYTAYLGTYLVLDHEGTVLEVSESAPDKDLILLSGISFTTFKTGKKLDLENTNKLDTAAVTFNAIKKADDKGTYIEEFLPLVEEISFADKKNIHMMLKNKIMAIIPADDNITYNINSLLDIYFKSLQVKGNGVLDFTGTNPVFTPITGQKQETSSATTQG